VVAKTRLQDVKALAKALTELSESQKDAENTIREMSRQAALTKKLWREGNKSRLIQIGVALFMVPEPTPVTPALGACFIAAGAVQKGIQNQSMFLEDIGKTFQSNLKELIAAKYDLQI